MAAGSATTDECVCRVGERAKRGGRAFALSATGQAIPGRSSPSRVLPAVQEDGRVETTTTSVERALKPPRPVGLRRCICTGGICLIYARGVRLSEPF
jgi:hypothetical protein